MRTREMMCPEPTDAVPVPHERDPEFSLVSRRLAQESNVAAAIHARRLTTDVVLDYLSMVEDLAST